MVGSFTGEELKDCPDGLQGKSKPQSSPGREKKKLISLVPSHLWIPNGQTIPWVKINPLNFWVVSLDPLVTPVMPDPRPSLLFSPNYKGRGATACVTGESHNEAGEEGAQPLPITLMDFQGKHDVIFC